MSEHELQTYTSSSPLLLVTAFSASHQGGGAVILRSLMGEQGSPRVVWASLAASDGPSPGRVAHRRSQRSPWLLPPGRLAKAIDCVAERHAARAIWLVAHGPIVPAVAPLVRRFGRPVHLSVHDDPAWSVAFRTRRELPLTGWLNFTFLEALKAANSVDVISAGMRAELARRSGIDSVVVHRVIDGPIRPNREYGQQSDDLSLGILGSVYAPRQFDVLLRCLARAARVVGAQPRLVVLGTEVPRLVGLAGACPEVEVTFLGHRAEEEGIDILRRVFALYLGYPFGRRERVMRRTSFPAKLATYLAAARPLLVHAPYESTLTPLVDVAPFTIPWFSNDVGAGARQLARAWEDQELRRSQHEPAEVIRKRYFGPDNRTRLFETLDRLPRG